MARPLCTYRSADAPRSASRCVALLAACGCICLSLHISAQAQPFAPKDLAIDYINRLAASARQANYSEVKGAQTELVRLGEGTVPLISAAIRTNTNLNLKRTLVDVLGAMDGQLSTQELFHLALYETNTSVRVPALNYLARRSLAGLRASATTGELQNLLYLAENGSNYHSASWARVAVQVADQDPVKLAKALTAGLLRRIEAAKEQGGKFHPDSYLGNEAGFINPYILAFKDATNGYNAPLLRKTKDQVRDPEIRQWLSIAIAMAGDQSAAAEIEPLIKDETEEPSNRAVALRAYSWGATACRFAAS